MLVHSGKLLIFAFSPERRADWRILVQNGVFTRLHRVKWNRTYLELVSEAVQSQ